jgi:hypothetical protein
MTSAIVVNSDTSLQTAIGVLRETYASSRFVRMSLRTGKARSLNQNDISHVWYEQLARELREDDALGWKCYCKLHHGVPILRTENADFREAYDSAIKGLGYEQKLKVMRLLPVTSLMTKTQLTAYLEAVRDDFYKRGVLLLFPEAA